MCECFGCECRHCKRFLCESILSKYQRVVGFGALQLSRVNNFWQLMFSVFNSLHSH